MLPVIVISEPLILNVRSSPSASVAKTVPILVWFSSALNVEDEVITGVFSLSILFTFIVMSCVVEKLPSLTVTEAEYDDCVS